MKLVTAVVQPHRLDDVKEALTGLGMAGLTVTEGSGHGTGRIGDGKIWATDLVEVVRVRTGERGESAV